MSPEAVARRLDEVRALYKLTMSLGTATVLGPAERCVAETETTTAPGPSSPRR